MKLLNTFLILTVSTSLVCMSCNKKRSCTCDYTAQYPTEGTPGSDEIPLGRISEGEATDSCVAIDVSYSENPYYISSECQLD